MSINFKANSAIGLLTYGFLLIFNSNIYSNSAPLRDISLQIALGLGFDFSRSLKVKCYSTNWLPMYGLLLMFNSNIWPNAAPVQDITLWNLSHIDVDLARSPKVKYDGAIGLPIYVVYTVYMWSIWDHPHIYGLLLMFIWPHWAPLWGIRLQSLSDFEIDFSR